MSSTYAQTRDRASVRDNDTGARTQVPGGNPLAVRSGDSLVTAGKQVPGGNRAPALQFTYAQTFRDPENER